MPGDRIPLSRSDLRDMERWIGQGWLPDNSAVERIRDSLVSIATERSGNPRAAVRAARILFRMEVITDAGIRNSSGFRPGSPPVPAGRSEPNYSLITT